MSEIQLAEPGPDLLTTLPEDQREALRRCSVMALFNSDAYDSALRPDAGPDLSELIKARLVERLSGGDYACRVPPSLQDMAWSSWFPHGWPAPRVPAPLRAVASEVVRWCKDNDDDVERLRALLLVDRRRARSWFHRAFAARDETSDLAGCENLLEALCEPERRPLVGSALAADVDDRTRYLAARKMWSAANYSSDEKRYLPRADLEARMEAVVTGGPWMLRLTGSGGNGKSTLLRWFLARRCVPERIPCALVDLDQPLDPVNAARHPWLVLLEIAYQLRDQMAGRPFDSLLHEYESYRRVLYPDTTAKGRAAAAALGTPTGLADATETVAIFLDALRDATPPAPVVVIDTVEEAMLRPAADGGPLLSLLNRLRRETCLRIVVAGRGTAPEAGLAADEEVKVDKFSDAQSRNYLTDVRKLKDRELVDGIVTRARGLPWQLALWGDVVAANPQLTWIQLAHAEPEAAWVVDRIVGRIDNVALQWLVRYGVVPRKLRRDFAEEVLIPRIRATVEGLSYDDRPETDARPQGGEAISVFDTDVELPASSDEFSRLWEQLTRYASTASWIWLADGDADTVVFQAELRSPVRALLAAQPIGTKLHHDAVEYYSRLVTENPERWVSWTCEAIYHRFCGGFPDAKDQWRAAVARARQVGLGGDAIAQLAGEVLGPDYLVDTGEGVPLRSDDGRPVIDRQTRAAAHAALAWALCRTALRQRLPGGHATWSMVESNLAAVGPERLDPESDTCDRSARAALNLARGRPDLATPMFEALAAAGGPPSVDRCIVLLLLSEAQATEPDRRREARSTLGEAAAVADALGVGEVSARIAVAVAEGAVELGRLDEAAEGLRRTVQKHPQLADDAELRRTVARCALDVGHPSVALAATPASEPAHAEALLAMGDAEAAVRTCNDLLAGLVEPEGRAAVLVTRGQAQARLLLVDQAFDDLAAAREAYGQIGDIEAAGLCTALAAEVALRDVGSLLEAAQYLDESARLPLDPGSAAWAHCRLLTAELATLRGDSAAASRTVAETFDVVIGRCGDPRLTVQVALAAFCVSQDVEPLACEALQTNLPLIGPEAARLTALTALPRCPPWEWGRHLLKATLPMGLVWESEEPPDRPWLQLRVAELMRVAGRGHEAAELITAATDALAETTPLAGWIWLSAVRRPGLTGIAEHPAARRVPDDRTFPLLASAQRITLAEYRFAAGDMAGALAQLRPAGEALERAPARATDWKRRLHDLHVLLTVASEAAESGPSRDSLMQEATRRQLGYTAQVTAAESPEPPPPAGEEHGLTVTFDGTAQLALSSSMGGTTLPRFHPLVAALQEETRTTGRSSVVSWVRAQLDGPDGLLRLDGLVSAHQPEVTLLAADPRVAQLPWELATVAGEPLAGRPGARIVHRAAEGPTATRTRVRMLQEALTAASVSPGPVDGLHGPQTAAALLAFQQRANVAPDGAAGELTWAALRKDRRRGRPRVLVVQQGPSAAEIAAMYRKRGWDAAVAGSSGEAELAIRDPVDVLHIAATMQVTGAVPVIGLGSEDGSPRPETVTCTLLDALVRRLAQRGNTPLLVLDVAPQIRRGEAIRQVLLRNDFAQQLLGMGQCYAVLATGPTRTPDPKRLVAAITEAATATDLAQRLQTDNPEPDEVMPRAATALFTAVLADRMPALGRSSGGVQGRRQPP